MVIDLYFLAKTCANDDSLTNWANTKAADNSRQDVLSYNLEKFKFKQQDQFQDFLKEVTYEVKENDFLRKLFAEFSGDKIDVEFIDDYHHCFLYDDKKAVLYLDAKIDTNLTPLYIFAFYFSLARQKYTANQIYAKFFDFLESFESSQLQKIVSYLNSNAFDPGAYLQEFLKLVLNAKKHNLKSEDTEKYRQIQLLRNRAIAGQLPFDLKAFSFLLEDCSQSFSAEINQELFDLINESYDHEYAKKYYKNLCRALNIIAVKVVAQRGSRVAHEQGPLLVNAKQLSFADEFKIQVKKTKSRIEESFSKLKEKLKAFDLDFVNDLTDISIKLDSLVYVTELKDIQLARFKKELIAVEKTCSAFTAKVKKYIREFILQEKQCPENLLDETQGLLLEIDEFLQKSFFDLASDAAKQKSELANSVIYLQRLSARSGHFLARILLGQKLYVETDENSEIQRLDAIPFTFVCPDLDLVASGINSFFENASISILTDKDTGKPEIKWDNAEDLAKTLAPSLFQAIINKQNKLKDGDLFHYQLETTLLGPLIDLFKIILENEISNIASVSEYVKTLGPNACYQELLKQYIDKYEAEICHSAKFISKFYLLENSLEEIILLEKLNEQKALLELLKHHTDVQKDCFALMAQLKAGKITESKLEAILQSNKSSKEKLAELQKHLYDKIDIVSLKREIKDKLYYPSSTAIKEFFVDNPEIKKVTVSSNKNIKDADYFYNFSVAPSRIDFGKHVVASVTTLMGRMIGADDNEALKLAKNYIDFVSQSRNSIFSTASEAGSVKVIENTCRAIQYAKAISFQGAFQSFAIDGMQARQTINSRNTPEAGLHVMEFATMASTGYCITKEPLFIILGLSLKSKKIFEQIGIFDETLQLKLQTFFENLISSKSRFQTQLDWELHAYEEIASSSLIQSYIADARYKILPRPEAFLALLKFMAHESPDQKISALYNEFSANLIEMTRVINETGIIQRVQLVNNQILASDKDYSKLKILMNASYKGNVSDERENANQYILAFLLNKKQFLKNSSNETIKSLIDFQASKNSFPQEIKIFDPFVDKDLFMNGVLKQIAQDTLTKIQNLQLSSSLEKKFLEACFITYGANVDLWQNLSLDDKKQIKAFAEDLLITEIYLKGFYTEADCAFQNLDIAFLNSDHDAQKNIFKNMVRLKELMLINNPDSLLTLVDNPQQAKKPFLDFDLSREWLALGGKIVSHMIAPELYKKWLSDINAQAHFAKLFSQFLIYKTKYSDEVLANNDDFISLKTNLTDYFVEMKKYADLSRDMLLQKFEEAKELGLANKVLSRYSFTLKSYAKLVNYQEFEDINFVDWLCLGGRWVLNGKSQKEIDYIIKTFEDSHKKVGKLGYQVLSDFVAASDDLNITRRYRIIENAGSTKEADLLLTNAADTLEQRETLQEDFLMSSIRFRSLFDFDSKYSNLDQKALSLSWDQSVQDLMTLMKNSKSSLDTKKEFNLRFAKILKITHCFSKYYEIYLPAISTEVDRFIKQRAFCENSIQVFFGDHKKSQGLYKELVDRIKNSERLEAELDNVIKLAEMLYFNYLLFLTINVADENEMINKLAIFFDQYLNVHEEDYPPYMFHSLCAGSAFGFDQSYFYDTNLRVKMFKLACKSGIHLYKQLYFLISQKTVLAKTSDEYKDSLIGDYENGLMPFCYQHETVCIEERLWDCMRALRNFVRNYHDRHPLPVVIKSKDATIKKLFALEDDVELVWLCGVANPGKHSWDLNCVLRSPELRKVFVSANSKYSIVSVFSPYLTANGEVKQIYTAFEPEKIKGLDILYPFKNSVVEENKYGFIHAIVDLQGQLVKPDITMAAHTHEQYVSNFLRDLKVPEVWSLLSMRQMYAKTELAKILETANLSTLAQVEFLQKEFDNKDELKSTIEKRIKNRNLDHIDFWIVKASKDSGGRGISTKLHLTNDIDMIVDFIFEKTKTDDVVMQEFVPNNARAFINNDFYQNIVNSFVNSGIAIENVTPYEQMFFAMRAFQSISGIKGYLFSVNIGNVTVNAGQGAKLFYGEPIKIMPMYIAGKIQTLLDDEGEIILKEAIPAHAQKFARDNDIKIVENVIGSNNCFMLNGLFDYIPYLYVERNDSENNLREFKVFVEDNAFGGLDFYYNYFSKKILLLSEKNQEKAVLALEELLKSFANGECTGPELKLDIKLAKIELNSGLGQANLLQNAIEAEAKEQRNLFLEWSEDLGAIAYASKKAQEKSS